MSSTVVSAADADSGTDSGRFRTANAEIRPGTAGIEGEDTTFASGGTKAEQTGEGRDRALSDRVEHIIKDENGQIAERHSYGHDPRNVPG